MAPLSANIDTLIGTNFCQSALCCLYSGSQVGGIASVWDKYDQLHAGLSAPTQKWHMSGLSSFHGTKEVTEPGEHRCTILPCSGPLQGDALVYMITKYRACHNPYTTKYLNHLT